MSFETKELPYTRVAEAIQFCFDYAGPGVSLTIGVAENTIELWEKDGTLPCAFIHQRATDAEGVSVDYDPDLFDFDQ